MTNFTAKTYKNVCPINCPISCTMISHVENNHLFHITGDPSNPFTKGKLCAKGFSYIEKINHPDRLKFPYYQEVKGTGKFKKITWEKAYDLIMNKIVNIHKKDNNFLPLALYKGSGNIGVHHFVTDDFFSSIGKTTRVMGSPLLTTGIEAIQYDVGAVQMSDPSMIGHASLITIWGANPAATNIYLVPILLEAKGKGAKIIVIDPVYTQTAELADLYIQILPGTDGALANVLIKGMIENDTVDREFLENYTIGFDSFLESIKRINTQEYLGKCGVTKKAIDLLLNLLKDAETVSYIVGFGLQKHSNGGQIIRAIDAVAAIHGDIGKLGGGIFLCQRDSLIFNNQRCRDLKNRITPIYQMCPSKLQPPIEMMWISCGNPLTQEPGSRFTEQFIKDIPFVVTVDQFLTPTAQLSNLILPTTTNFEELDIVISSLYKGIALNEKAISPYYESKSEWAIMKELAIRLNRYQSDLCSFPIDLSEEEYLNAQFNDYVFERYHINTISELKGKVIEKNLPKVAWVDKEFATRTGKYQFYSEEAKRNSLPSIPIFINGKMPSVEYPFWLITSHHPYRLNSQFHFLHISEENEACVEMNSKTAKKIGIFNGEVIKVFNDLGEIEIKAVYSDRVPKDILLVYEGWYPNSKVNINRLVSSQKTDMGTNGKAFYDTFVNVAKW